MTHIPRRWTVLIVVVALILGALALGLWMTRGAEGRGRLVDLFETFPKEDRLEVKPADFRDLRGWQDDAVEEAVPVLLRSCARIAALPDGADVRGEGPDEVRAGKAEDWRPACAAAAALPPGDRAAARRFFEERFRPWSVRNHRNPIGLFTGYYEPLLHGSRTRHGRFTVPLYGRPPELVMVDLGRFRDDLRGKRIAGRVEAGALVPYPDRKAIDDGVLAGRKLEIVWVDDPVEAFFLQVQGSGRVELEEGGTLRIGYVAQNGHPYSSIGKALIQRGILTPDTVSMQSIRAWLRAHPDQTAGVLEKDASYVFFQEVEGDGPMGAEGVPLTPGRSLAVDLRYLPLGAPVWITGHIPAPTQGEPARRLHRLMVAQDTGGAIRGPVRGDVFFGFGPEAEAQAGRMKHRGKLWVLLPRGVAAGR
jgi:membrane-bound lytic murein transglycosylase A